MTKISITMSKNVFYFMICLAYSIENRVFVDAQNIHLFIKQKVFLDAKIMSKYF